MSVPRKARSKASSRRDHTAQLLDRTARVQQAAEEQFGLARFVHAQIERDGTLQHGRVIGLAGQGFLVVAMRFLDPAQGLIAAGQGQRRGQGPATGSAMSC